MQLVLNTFEYPDLYRFLAAMAQTSYELDDRPELPREIVIWSPMQQSGLLDEPGKLEMVEQYARKMHLDVILSAASNLQLRDKARQIGWKVLWEMPGLDAALRKMPYNQPYTTASDDVAQAC